MANLGVVFLTGLTTGGLSCLAVQGGLLASSVVHQAEKDIHQQLAAEHVAQHVRRKGKQQRASSRPHPAVVERPKHHLTWPIVLFLAAKLVASTVLGFLLGWLGSMLQLTPFMRAMLQFAIGIFLVGTALRMFEVHPIFRYFALEPPALLTRYMRRRSRTSARDSATPLVLGALTVFIPCGVTQAMMALAVGSGDPWLGAAIMFAFTLGTTPVFFGLAYLATRLGAAAESRFAKVTAVVVLMLGLISIDAGLNLAGSPLSFAGLRDAFTTASGERAQRSNRAELPATSAGAGEPAQQTGATDSQQAAAQSVVTINALDYGYEPQVARAKAGQPVELRLVTNASSGCTRAFVIPALNLQRVLPETGTTVIDLPPQRAGTLRFTCAMGMFGGAIRFE